MNDDQWRTTAACRERTGIMFDKAQQGAAQDLCASCPAGQVCLWATMLSERPGCRYGVAGGLTPGQRTALAQRVPQPLIEAAHTAALAAWEVRQGRTAPAPEPAGSQRHRPRKPPQKAGPVQDPVSREINAAVAAAYGMAAEQLSGPSRTRHVVSARQVAMYVLRELAGMSYPAIGAALGRDHTTVMSAVERVVAKMADQPALRRGVERLVARLGGGDAGEAAAMDDLVERVTGLTELPDGSGADIEAVLAEAARVCGVRVEEIRGRSRTRHVADARHVVMYALREVRGLSYPAIGMAVGGRDHTTAMHAVERVRAAVPGPTLIGRQAALVVGALAPVPAAEAA